MAPTASSGPDIERLAARAARGDAAAFAEVCHALQGDVWRYCHSLTGDRDLAADAAQDTFLRAVTAIRGFRGDAPVRLWMLAIARRAAASAVRARASAPRPVDAAARSHRADIEEQDASLRIVIDQLVADLPDDLRQAFALTQIVGLTYQDAATVMDCPVGTIRSRVHRARERLVTAYDSDDEVGRAAK